MTAEPRTIHFVSLGCPKNRVDTEVMLGVARRAGYSHVADPADARVIVVNTCGFIDAAKKESVETIVELGTHKQAGTCQQLVVAGCLVQRYANDLATELPEVDSFLGSSDMLRLADVLEGSGQRLFVGNPAEWVVRATDPRVLSTPGASAYVKIGEGCNRRCAFCVIPQIRGKQRSRPAADVVDEVRRLADSGVLEVNLVSQDTVAYGRDLEARPKLSELVRAVADVPGIRWVRLFYLYPETLDEPLVELLAGHPRVVPYVDMPLQHASDAMLRRMRRGHGGRRLRELVERLRARAPNLTLRSAFIVGHPGETEADFVELCDFVRWAELDRVGVFHYSDEETAASHALDGKVPRRVARQRARRLMAIQRPISRRKNRALVGRSLEVLVEGPSAESELVMVGRHAGQAPDIDGCVYLSGGPLRAGQMRTVRVEKATTYDLLAEVLDDTEEDSVEAPRREPAPVYRASDGRSRLRSPPYGRTDRRVQLRTVR